MLIIGTGAVATFLAQSLASIGEPFQIFGAPSPRLEALNLRFGREVGVSEVRDVGSHRQWLVALKTWQNKEKVELLSRAPKPESVLVLQNGLKPEEDWYALSGVEVERALSTYGVRVVSPAEVSGGERGEIVLSEGSCYGEFLARLGFQLRYTRNFELAVWHKLAVNASLNVVAALQGLSNGQVLEQQDCRRTVLEAAEEVARVALAGGLNWGAMSAGAMVERVAKGTAQNICSTLADLRSGRPTEYQAINGEVLRRAWQFDVQVPVLQDLDAKFSELSPALFGSTFIAHKESGLPTLCARLPILGGAESSARSVHSEGFGVLAP